MFDTNEIHKRAKAVFDIEIEGLAFVRDHLDEAFAECVKRCAETLDNGGKLVITGIGKSAHIGHKIAATLASTGSPSIFMHPVEALHGDIGMMQKKDLMIAISYSGETDELLAILPAAKRLGNPIIALTGNLNSRLAKAADLTVSCAVPREACPFNLAPTTTTTATLALGDALAMVLLEMSGFSREDFGRLHPGGAIGRAVTLTVREILRTDVHFACVGPETTVKETLLVMTRARAGSAAIVDETRHLLGIFTDGDFRRHAESDMSVLTRKVSEVMTISPVTVSADALAVEVLKIFESRRIDDIVALEKDGTVAGAIDIQDLPGLKLF